MSFLSSLGKILGVAGGVAAIPFTGGASATMLPAILGAGGAAVSALSKGAAQNQSAKTAATIDQAQLAERANSDYNNQLLQRAQLEMQQQEADQNAKANAFKTALHSALGLNFTPAARPSGV